jgi:hypothetical protein
MNKKLEKEAEEYRDKEHYRDNFSYDGFIAGSTSKYVEKEKLQFAIEQLIEFKEHYQESIGTGKIWNRIQELQQKLEKL